MTDLQVSEKEELFIAMKTTKSKRLYEHYQTIYLYLQNHSKPEIKTMIGHSEKTSIIM